MLFIYWGWDTTVSVNEETGRSATIPGRAAVTSTFVLLVTYLLVVLVGPVLRRVGYRRGSDWGTRPTRAMSSSGLGHAVFGTSGFGSSAHSPLLLMVLSSAAASTQTTILPTARTSLSMAVYKSVPSSFAKIHPQAPDPDGVDADHGWGFHRSLRDHELHVGRRR